MQVIRKTTIETEEFQVGDCISFELQEYGWFTATVIDVTDEGTTFIFNESVEKRPMNYTSMKCGATFEETELYKWLSNDMLLLFPVEWTLRIANITLPSISDMYGKHVFAPAAYDVYKSLPCYRLRRPDQDYIQCTNYWLCDQVGTLTTLFSYVECDGHLDKDHPIISHGVCPKFLLKPLEITNCLEGDENNASI